MKRYPSQISNQAFIRFLATQVIRSGDSQNAPIVFDATAGNGHDTLWLAELVGEKGSVYAVDVQEAALQTTRQRLQEAGLDKRVSLFLSGHEKIAYLFPEDIRGKLALAIYNLGYLPGSDKSIMTLPETTITSLNECKTWLRPGGIIIVTVYPGHNGGDKEASLVEKWFKALDSRYWHVAHYHHLNRQAPAPHIFIMEATPSI